MLGQTLLNHESNYTVLLLLRDYDIDITELQHYSITKTVTRDITIVITRKLDLFWFSRLSTISLQKKLIVSCFT